MIKLTQLLNELGINNPNTLIPGKKYKIWNNTWNKWEILEFESEYSTNMGNRIVFKTGNGSMSIGKENYIKKGWIKPYKEEVNELGINNPNPTVKEVYNYYYYYIGNMNNEQLWEEYKQLSKLYCKKYKKYKVWVDLEVMDLLSQQELNKFYREMKHLVKKYTGINELGINNPNPTAEEVYDYYLSLYNTGWAWHKIEPTFQKYIDKNPEVAKSIGIYEFLKSLPQSDLNQIYRQLKQINELNVNNPNVDWERVWAQYCYLRQDYDWKELYEIIFKKYDSAPKFKLRGGGIPTYIRNLSQPELNKLYRELKQLEKNGK